MICSAEKWVEKKLFNKNGKPYSFTISVKYSNHLNNHILPALCHKKIDKIKSLHIVDFIDIYLKMELEKMESLAD
ncbi:MULTISPECIES: hypothetical protein [Bacillus]|uniref:hypothetical protein n=1 Tax=Bacillus subtilis TaxID=1423 RepID=UPI002867D5B9|nr:hypothetical protein [Bacillus subtilis]